MSPDAAHAPVRVKFDVEAARREFPILEERIHGRPLVYLDNANTTQKPKLVLETLDEFYRHQNANIHRATHQLSERATAAYEGARAKIARFIGARETGIDAPSPAPVKFALSQRGRIKASVRLPLVPASDAARAKILDTIKRYESGA